MYRVGFFVCSGHDPLDLAGPLSAFNLVAKAVGHKPYELHVVSHSGGAVIGNSGLPVETAPAGKQTFDTEVFL